MPRAECDHAISETLRLRRRIEMLEAEVASLQPALEIERRIGAAVGLLMAARKMTYEDAFELLARASQHKNRKVGVIAEEVLLAGNFWPDSTR